MNTCSFYYPKCKYLVFKFILTLLLVTSITTTCVTTRNNIKTHYKHHHTKINKTVGNNYPNQIIYDENPTPSPTPKYRERQVF